MEKTEIVSLRDEAIEKFFTLWDVATGNDVKRELSLSLSQGGAGEMFRGLVDSLDEGPSLVPDPLLPDKADLEEMLDSWKHRSIQSDNYLVFSIENVTNPPRFEGDMAETESVQARVGVQRAYAEQLHELLSRDPQASVELPELSDITQRDNFTGTFVLDSSSLRRTFLGSLKEDQISLKYDTVHRYPDEAIQKRHDEKMTLIEKIQTSIEQHVRG